MTVTADRISDKDERREYRDEGLAGDVAQFLAALRQQTSWTDRDQQPVAAKEIRPQISWFDIGFQISLWSLIITIAALIAYKIVTDVIGLTDTVSLTIAMIAAPFTVLGLVFGAVATGVADLVAHREARQ